MPAGTLDGRRIAVALSILLVAAVLFGCGARRDAARAPTQSPPPSTGPPAAALAGRSPLLLCVEVLDDTDTGSVVDAVRAGLGRLADEGLWPFEDTPDVTVGCPLPPLALDASIPTEERRVCSEQVSPFRVHIFVADAPRFGERFPTQLLRRAPHEFLTVGEHRLGRCFQQTSEAWYMTPAELGDHRLLGDYVAGIFPPEGQ